MMAQDVAFIWHLITGEYPPQPGGVADYTRLIAQGFAQTGDIVHVWAPQAAGVTPEDASVSVHRLPDHFGRRGLRQLGAELRRDASPSQVLVQYVPHMYGYRGMNLGLASWLRLRAPRYWVMFHEVAFALDRQQKLTRNILGGVQHVMAALVAGGADEIFVSVPRWESLLRTRCRIRRPIHWLPVPSNVPTAVEPVAVRHVREQLLGNSPRPLLGHFGTFQPQIVEFLMNAIPPLLRRDEARRMLVIGRGSGSFAQALADRSGDLRDRILARDDLPARDVAEHLAACDVLLQPYTDGVSSRRGSAMAGLALGRPIVTTEAEATEPIWRRDRLVEAVPLDDVDVFIGRVEALLGSSEDRAQLGDRARRGYEANFSCQKTVATLREMRG
jgi:glycosyltransferase involved in cell wall biosynthesis